MSKIITEVPPGQFDLCKSHLTDRGHFCEDIHDADLKKMILQYGPCRPGGSFECIKEDGSVSSNFSARYYDKHVKHISFPRLNLKSAGYSQIVLCISMNASEAGSMVLMVLAATC